MQDSQYSELLDALYRAALDADALRDFLALLVRTLHAKTGNIISTDQHHASANFAYAHGIPALELERYATYFWKVDCWRLGAARINLPPGQVVRGRDLVSDEDLLASEFYRDSLARIGIFHWCGMTLQPAPEQRFLISVQRAREAGPFPRTALDELQRLKPHLVRCAQIIRELNSVRQRHRMVIEAIENVPFGVVFLRSDATITQLNSHARSMLDCNDGLRVVNNRMCGARTSDDEALVRLLQRATSSDETAQANTLSIERPSGKRPYSVLCTPFEESASWLLEDTPRAILFITDPERAQASPLGALQTGYKLTAREAHLAVALLGGDSLADVARQMGITINTARSYLRIVFRKTQTRRQSDLVRLLLSLPQQG